MTVRRGIKTYQEVEQLTDADNNPVGWGKIKATPIMRFCDINEKMFKQYHHMAEVRNAESPILNIFTLMQDYYTLFFYEEIVTVVYFEIINEKGQ